MKSSSRCCLKTQFLPFLILGICLIIFHLFAPIPIADDIIFQTRPRGIFDFDFFVRRYHGWSSRIIIEFFTVLLLKLPSIIWRLLNPLIITIMAIIISKTFVFIETNTEKSNWMLVFLILLYPFREIFAGGWVTISLNYIWPMAFGFYSIYLLKRIVVRSEISIFSGIVSLLLLLYALNQEIIAGILFIVFTFANIYLLFKKRKHWFTILCLVLSILSLIFIITTPGNISRSHKETRWFVDFHYLSFVERLEIGLSSTFSQYFFHFSILFFIFCLILGLSISKYYKDIILRSLGLFPLVNLTVFSNVSNPIIGNLFPHLLAFDPFLSKYGLITLGNFTDIQTHLVLLILYISMLAVFINIYLVFGNSWKGVISIGIFSLGLLSRLVLSFSPTIWASGLRTHFLFFISIILISIIAFQELLLFLPNRILDNLIIIIGFIAGYAYLNSLMAII